jgi:hypothetical protein
MSSGLELLNLSVTGFDYTHHPLLHRFRGNLLGDGLPALPPSMDHLKFVQLYPPTFVQENDMYRLVKNDLSMRIILALDLSKFVGVIEKGEIREGQIVSYADLDRRFYASLQEKPKRYSRPWEARQRKILHDQLCPICALARPTVPHPLSAPQYWRRAVVQDAWIALRCRTCRFWLLLPTPLVVRFVKYDLPTKSYLRPVLKTGGHPQMCGECDSPHNYLFDLLLPEVSRVCANGLRHNPSCKLMPPSPKDL